MGSGDVILVVDVGTSGTRCSVVDLEARIRGVEVRPPASALSPHGLHELDPERLWTDVSEAIRAVAGLGRVRAVCVAAQLGIALLDEDLEPLGGLLTWSDRRGEACLPELRERLGSEGAVRAGRPLAGESLPVKVAWIRETEPHRWTRVRWLSTIKDHLVARLTGGAVTDPTSAGYSMAFDVRAGRWSPRSAEALGLPAEFLPEVMPATDWLPLSWRAAEELDLPAETPVAVGGPDGTVGAVGAGGVVEGVTVDVAGSTDVIVHVIGQASATASEPAILNAHLVPGLWTLGGPTGSTGAAVEWTARLLGYLSAADAYAALSNELDTLPIGSEGVRFDPALTGHRFPSWDTGATGRIVGLRPHHGPLHVFGAAREGAAFLVRRGLEALQDRGASIDEIVLVGGVSRRPQTVQLRADLWQLPIRTPTVPDATTIGGAMIGSVAAGLDDNLRTAAQRFVGASTPCGPDLGRAQEAASAYERWLS